jgi:hypothetical protein
MSAYENIVKQIDEYLKSKGETNFNGYHLNSDWTSFDRWEYTIEKPGLKVNKPTVPQAPSLKRTQTINNIASI